jgi:aldehyde dehydrogenase (NAD+)
VEEKIHDEFVARLAEKARARRLGDPLDPHTQQGPQVSQQQQAEVLRHVERGLKEGAVLVTGGKRRGKNGFFVEPTVFDNVSDEMTIAREEIFGPVVSVFAIREAAELIRRANNTPYGLAAAIWTKDLDKAHWFAKTIRAGTVWINCYHIIEPTTPFGGFKMSGHGRENGEEVLQSYCETKTVTIRVGY